MLKLSLNEISVKTSYSYWDRYKEQAAFKI